MAPSRNQRRYNRINNYRHDQWVKCAQAQDRANCEEAARALSRPKVKKTSKPKPKPKPKAKSKAKHPLSKVPALQPRPLPAAPHTPPKPVDKELAAHKPFLDQAYKQLSEVDRIWKAGGPFRAILGSSDKATQNYKRKQMVAIKKILRAKKLVADHEKVLAGASPASSTTIKSPKILPRRREDNQLEASQQAAGGILPAHVAAIGIAKTPSRYHKDINDNNHDGCDDNGNPLPFPPLRRKQPNVSDLSLLWSLFASLLANSVSGRSAGASKSAGSSVKCSLEQSKHQRESNTSNTAHSIMAGTSSRAIGLGKLARDWQIEEVKRTLFEGADLHDLLIRRARSRL
ncbi:hypothetical protein CBOM_05686 [Ceraceosorus bombacis]|uniref:Uncharacterized protein n=1 Tax=Ceraceosorus bombacis TaxID=401625 RepID=A0A0P1BQ21_9BASI|nr:hypothetical protein CBOM_05686 [Ceraceosorus bombacis]